MITSSKCQLKLYCIESKRNGNGQWSRERQKWDLEQPGRRWCYDDNGDNTLFSTLMTLGWATRISLSKKSKNRLTKSLDKTPSTTLLLLPRPRLPVIPRTSSQSLTNINKLGKIIQFKQTMAIQFITDGRTNGGKQSKMIEMMAMSLTVVVCNTEVPGAPLRYFNDGGGV